MFEATFFGRDHAATVVAFDGVGIEPVLGVGPEVEGDDDLIGVDDFLAARDRLRAPTPAFVQVADDRAGRERS